MNDSPDFAKLLARLTARKVDSIVVGGVAVGFNGFVRTTEDLDIFVEISGKTYHDMLPDTLVATFGAPAVTIRHLNRKALWSLKKIPSVPKTELMLK
jgi:hypothetical protein